MVIASSGNKFFIFGQELSPEEYLDALPEKEQTKMLFNLDKLNPRT
jgi:hypothetical protein